MSSISANGSRSHVHSFFLVFVGQISSQNMKWGRSRFNSGPQYLSNDSSIIIIEIGRTIQKLWPFEFCARKDPSADLTPVFYHISPALFQVKWIPLLDAKNVVPFFFSTTYRGWVDYALLPPPVHGFAYKFSQRICSTNLLLGIISGRFSTLRQSRLTANGWLRLSRNEGITQYGPVKQRLKYCE